MKPRKELFIYVALFIAGALSGYLIAAFGDFAPNPLDDILLFILSPGIILGGLYIDFVPDIFYKFLGAHPLSNNKALWPYFVFTLLSYGLFFDFVYYAYKRVKNKKA